MKRRLTFLLTICILAFLTPSWAREKGKIVTPGDFFPEFAFPMTLTKADAEYLGLPQKFLGLIRGESFSMKDVKADVILVECMNKYCFSCQLQAPILSQVFSLVEKDPQLKGRVKFISIGAGNNQQEVDSFRAEKKNPFPILPDSKFQAYEAIGDPGATPFFLILRRTDSGLLIARTRIGLTRDSAVFLKEINDSLNADVDTLLQQFKDPTLQQAKAKKLLLRYNEEELLNKVKESMAGPKRKVLKVAKVALPDGEEIYVGEVEEGKEKFHLFARLSSRAPTCDICHATHFIFVFNEKGMITNFFPLQTTKVDNKPWNAKEIEQMRQRLVGRSILQPMDFDPKLDAIASATMTAALIVDSVNRAKSLYEGLKVKGYVK